MFKICFGPQTIALLPFSSSECSIDEPFDRDCRDYGDQRGDAAMGEAGLGTMCVPELLTRGSLMVKVLPFEIALLT